MDLLQKLNRLDGRKAGKKFRKSPAVTIISQRQSKRIQKDNNTAQEQSELGNVDVQSDC
jgi:hypothetical protein